MGNAAIRRIREYGVYRGMMTGPLCQRKENSETRKSLWYWGAGKHVGKSNQGISYHNVMGASRASGRSVASGVSTKHDDQPEESGIWFRLVDMGAEPSTV
jgi:hypothetical protein